MNKERRQRLQSCIEKLAELEEEIEQICNEEEEAYENMPGDHFGDKGQKMQFNVDALQEAVSTLQDLESSLEEVME